MAFPTSVNSSGTSITILGITPPASKSKFWQSVLAHSCRNVQHESHTPFVAADRQQTTSEMGWWLSSLRGLGENAMPAVYAAYHGLRRGHRAEAARQTARFTKYDGLVAQAGADLDPCRPDTIQSASGLERFAACPFGYYLQKALGLEAPEENDPNPDEWLDPMSRGGLLHGIYSAFLRALRAETRRPAKTDW